MAVPIEIAPVPPPPGPPPPIPRLWAYVFVVGILLVVAGTFVTGVAGYLFLTQGFPGSYFTTYDLRLAAAAFLNATGAIVAGVGWVVDRGILARHSRIGAPASSGFLAGRILVLAGAAIYASGWAYSGSILIVEYERKPIDLPESLVLVPAILTGCGLALVAIGWLLCRLSDPPAGRPITETISSP